MITKPIELAKRTVSTDRQLENEGQSRFIPLQQRLRYSDDFSGETVGTWVTGMGGRKR